jgi:RNA polymerase sigma-70 factor (ECF subfamily)
MGGLEAVDIRPQPAGGEDVEEAVLVERARAGDTTAFERLYRDNAGRVNALCWRLCGGDRALAEDMVQEAFIRAWNKLHLFKGEARFGTWLHRLTVNLVLSDRRIRVKRVKTEQPIEEHPEVQDGSVRDPDAGVERDLEAAIASLPERARTVLVLYDIEGYKHAEIAAMTGMAEGSSKAQLHRARKLVRETLER